MASLVGENLLKNPIFDEIKNSDDIDITNTAYNQLIALNGSNIYLWKSVDASVLTTNLKNNLRDHTRSPFQILLCKIPPLFEVISIILNQSGEYLALVGKNGVSVLKLPPPWITKDNERNKKNREACQTICIGERLFKCDRNLKILQVRWHPDILNGNSLAVLTNDNYFRLFSLQDSNKAYREICVSDQMRYTSNGSFKSSVSLGDQAVAFDFGPPASCDIIPENATIPISRPVFFLWSSGDIYLYHLVSDDENKKTRSKLLGPLVMLPPAEDNYGNDACSIKCLETNPPVLIIATPCGKLFHLIVLNQEQECLKDNSSEASWKISADVGLDNEPTLYFYETVELELSITHGSDSDECVNDSGFTIWLHSDPSYASRYHCSHIAGVHSVLIPWIDKFRNFIEDEKITALEENSISESAIVEHLICTKPHSSNEQYPVLGLDILNDRLLGPALLCLMSDRQCVYIPLKSVYIGKTPELLSSYSDEFSSPLRKVYKEPFNEHIAKILQRTVTNPLIKANSSSKLSDQEYFQILSRVTQIYREEYIQKLDHAQTEIQRRLRILITQKEYQLAEIQSCQLERNKLTDKAHDLADKYDDTLTHQQQLVARIEDVLKKLQMRLPALSEAERKMHSELKEMKNKMSNYKQLIQQISVKKQYQDNMVSVEKRTPKNVPSPQWPQVARYKDLLKNQSDQISNMISQVSNMKLQLQT